MRSTPPVPTRRLRRVEYECLVERGLFEPDDRVELIDGLLVVREPQSAPHLVALQLAQRALQRASGAGGTVRPPGPAASDEAPEPEPDLAVVPGAPRDYVGGHPARPALVVEVSVTRLDFDREYKASLYARAAIVDYWIVNLVDRVVEVRRRPITSDAPPYGWTYAAMTMLRPDASATPPPPPFPS